MENFPAIWVRDSVHYFGLKENFSYDNQATEASLELVTVLYVAFCEIFKFKFI